MNRLSIGTVVRAHGIKGWLRVRANSDVLTTLDRVFVDGRELRLLHVQAEKSEYLVQLEGVVDRNAAEALRGHTFDIDRDKLPALAAEEVYVADLIGCQVFDPGGARLGEVTSTFPGGGHEILVVKGTREFMLPLVDAIVTEIDVAQRRIVCDPPEGLVNLDEADSDQS